ncbi:MAG TPA: bifunctional lysine ketoglutarate reductase /saccharopine dehydrogenase family protein [Bacteroidales bacterium]|jgi:alpha-aminoadipic semialdehyde synthase|nr:bifunctional lysine ketoglutarate reductase /saccharopine dehydrogenase family protein [Bacteroidales bacterium]
MKVGIRIEDKYAAERRVAITPEHASRLIKKHQLEIQVLPCKKRIFKDEEYINAGCKLVEKLTEPKVIFGIKEIPESFFEEGKTYAFFSHTIKGQPYNMPMLKQMMKMKCNLIDYERVVDDNNRRLIFFGKFAGLAGMINSLWAYGLRLSEFGIDSPFKTLKQTHNYSSLEEAKEEIKKVGEKIKTNGLPTSISPLIIGLTGYGNVSKGAQEIIDLLPVKEITPEELLDFRSKTYDNRTVYKVIFKEEHLYKTKDNSPFILSHFFANPAEYSANFEQYIPHLTILMNCIYWDSKAEKLVTKKYLQENWKNPNFYLSVIGDITCDPNGSIEATHEGTPIENPIFIYHPETQKPTFGHKGDGVLIMAVDILPSELPRESSYVFADALEPFVYDIVTCDYGQPYEKLKLPAPIKRALILQNGELTPDYQYIKKFL